jgi:hypothetical protein
MKMTSLTGLRLMEIDETNLLPVGFLASGTWGITTVAEGAGVKRTDLYESDGEVETMATVGIFFFSNLTVYIDC